MSVRHYKLMLTTVGPLHVGNGGAYTKKDYFQIDSESVGVLDMPKFFDKLNPEERDDYCEFLRTGSNVSLQVFLNGHPRLQTLARKCVQYKVEMTLTKAPRGDTLFYDVAQFVKDAYGCPYIPGSSMKGMLRTALLTQLILDNPEGYMKLYNSSLARGKDRGKACRAIEKSAFWTESFSTNDGVETNDIMRYVSVSDSEPLTTRDLIFVKKYDRFANSDPGNHKPTMGRISQDPSYRQGNALNIYRECIKPGASVVFKLDIDDRIDAYLGDLTLDHAGITTILENAYKLYSKCFLDRFDTETAGITAGGSGLTSDGRCNYVYASGPLAGMRCRNAALEGVGYCRLHQEHAAAAGKQLTCVLGGGVDFDSKTIVNALFADESARLKEIAGILYSQFPTRLDPTLHETLQRKVRTAGYSPIAMHARWKGDKLSKGKDDHRHWMDEQLGVSPHTAKLGIIGSKKYSMGRCSITIEET